MTYARLLPLLFVATVAGGCKTERLQNQGCREDKDCGSPVSAFRCEAQTGVCFCRTNQACLPREFCNTAGFCQEKSGCEKNSDCLDPSLFCDTTSGTCLSIGRCTADLHCPLGEVCDVTRSTCVAGCRTSGDCAGSSCRCTDKACNCTGKTPAEVAQCEIGTCDPNFCADNTFCKFGEQCGVQPDAGNPLAQCFSDFDDKRRPYCANCTFGGGTTVCGTGANYCLVDTAHPGNSFCGADCAEGQTCPRGYNCSDVIVVLRQWQCGGSQGCPVNTQISCSDEKPCKRGGTCVKGAGQTSGHCAPSCGIDEGDSFGFCSCQVDSDCVQDKCSAGECTISRKKCIDDNGCRTVRCVDFQGAGGCLIGQNCAPADGLSCLEVQ